MERDTQQESNLLMIGASEGVSFTAGHHFVARDETSLNELAESLSAPLSVILQVTKKCDFDCTFCSETLQMPDPSLEDLDTMRRNLVGVSRVFLSGGEPLLRRDLVEVVSIFDSFIIGLPTNASRGTEVAAALSGKVAFANVGFDGPRGIFRRVRADGYDTVMKGIQAFIDAEIPISFSAVIYRSTLHGLSFLCQIADVLDAGKVKLILPLRKGNALGLKKEEFISESEANDTFQRLVDLRTLYEWRPALRLTTWTKQTEGHMLVIEPNGVVRAWPVYDQPDLWLSVGNLLEEPIRTIWERYPYKRQHVGKYLGKTIHTVQRRL